ncbi:MAG: protein kinase [Deltaproteobacteria bacterium]|nr:protein kinase [Deltaproteobacteria bacterium]
MGPYQIVRLLGAGGMGEVYEARAEGAAPIALKILASMNPRGALRFAREAGISIAKLGHPRVVRGIDVGFSQGHGAWFAMELIQGCSLRRRLAQGPLSVREALSLGVGVCDGLAHAHDRGIVHRDVKPENILLRAGAPEDPVLADLGVALDLAEQRLTQTGRFVGTVAYLSPEQAECRAAIDARSDLWSLGIVLFEALAGTTPFGAGGGWGTVLRILTEDPTELRSLRPGVPLALAALIHGALVKDPNRRVASAAQFGAALRGLLAGGADPARDAALRGPRGATPLAYAPTLAADTIAEGGGAESRLTSVVFLRGVRDVERVARLAREHGGFVVRLHGAGTPVVFGFDRWHGDEPTRGVNFALGALSSVEAVGVATGRCQRSASRIVGAVLDDAVAYARPGSVCLDPTTAACVRGAFALAFRFDGSATVDLDRAGRPPETIAPPYATPLIGREDAVQTLLRALERAMDHREPRAAFVVGDVGMGKSRLRQEASNRLREEHPDAVVLVARCESMRADTPFAVLRDALGAAITPALATALAASSEGDPQALLDCARAAFGDALLEQAEGGPTVLAIDDAQWLDPSSRAVLRWVLETSALPIAVWVFTRPDERLLAELGDEHTRRQRFTEVLLQPLGSRDAQRLLTAVAGEAPQELLDRAGGHPLLLEEFGRRFAQGGREALTDERLPATVEAAHQAQLDALSPSDRDLLLVASVFGRAFWAEGVRALGGVPEGLRRLYGQGLVAPRRASRFPGTTEWAFPFATLREVVYGALSPERAAPLHARAAAWLMDRSGSSPDELARHWDLGREQGRAAEAYVRAAEHAAHVANVTGACSHAERALALTTDPQLRWRALVAQDDALQLAGDRAKRQEVVQALGTLSENLGPLRQAEAAWRSCYLERVLARRDAARGEGERALALLEGTDNPRLAAAVHIELGLLAINCGELAAAQTHAETAQALAARGADTWLTARALGVRSVVCGDSGAFDLNYALAEEGASLFAQSGDRRREAILRNNAASAMLLLGHLDAAERTLRGVLEVCQRLGNLPTLGAGLHNLGVARRLGGDLAEAATLQDRAEEVCARVEHRWVACTVAIERVYLGLASGDPPGEVRAAASAALRKALPMGSLALEASARAALLRAWAREPPPAEELSAAQGLAPRLPAIVARVELLFALWDATGRGEDALVQAEEALRGLFSNLGSQELHAGCRATFARRFLLDLR